jgi:hypothetical protein
MPEQFLTSRPAHSYDTDMELTLGIWVNEGLSPFDAAAAFDVAATITADAMLAPALARHSSAVTVPSEEFWSGCGDMRNRKCCRNTARHRGPIQNAIVNTSLK